MSQYQISVSLCGNLVFRTDWIGNYGAAKYVFDTLYTFLSNDYKLKVYLKGAVEKDVTDQFVD